ncbi:MAG: GerAB/ArcD/ProY family transporter [Firmicutes bacterium]|nr:GerAB/ArcD/ProY family transporter [Bacillota bacterium]
MAAAYAGIEVIGRITDLFFPLFLGMILFSIVALAVSADFTNLQPVLARGIRPVLEGSLAPIATGAQLMIAGMLIPHTNQPRNAMKTVFCCRF